MLEKVKIIMDEQSRQSLDCLKENFKEILSPLEQLNQLKQTLGEFQESTEDSLGKQQRKLTSLEDAIANLKTQSEELQDKQDQAGKILSEFKKDYLQILPQLAETLKEIKEQQEAAIEENNTHFLHQKKFNWGIAALILLLIILKII